MPPPQEKFVQDRGLSFKNVLVIPRASDIRSRYGHQIDTSTQVALGAPPIKYGIVSANMDTVTGFEMAQAMAFNGCLGIIHRFMPPEGQANEIRLVKERLRVREDKPPMVPETASIHDATELLSRRNRGYVIVHSESVFSGPFCGIATPRDFLAGRPIDSITSVMTKRDQIKTVNQGTTLQKAVEFMKQERVEQVPIVDGDGNLVGMYALKDQELFDRYPNASLDAQGRLMVGAAIGVKDRDVERAIMLVEAGVDVLVLDIAHGHLVYTKEMLKKLKIVGGIAVPIITGNFATKEGVLYARDNGADGAKVGVGPGWACDTRIIAGVGVPQITAIRWAVEAVANDFNPIPIMADGGIREPGDIVKAYVAGASSVMIGTLFAGLEESPGEKIVRDGRLYKRVRGSASASAFQDQLALGTETDPNQYVPEGREVDIPFRGKLEGELRRLFGGIRSGMSYVGAHNLQEMWEYGQFIEITDAGANEHRRDLA